MCGAEAERGVQPQPSTCSAASELAGWAQVPGLGYEPGPPGRKPYLPSTLPDTVGVGVRSCHHGGQRPGGILGEL